MKRIITLFILFNVQNSFSQSVKIKFENIENIFTVNVLEESEDKTNILISDSTLHGQHMSFVFKEGHTQSTFVDNIVGNMKMIAKTYIYQFNDSILLGIKNKNLTYKNFELEKPKKEIFSNLIKLNLAFNSDDYVKSVDSILKILNNEENFVFKKSKEFKFEKNNSKLNIIYKDSIRFQANSLDELTNSLEENYIEIEQSLKKLFITQEEFNKIFELKLNEDYRRRLAEIYDEITQNSDYSFINNIIVNDSINKRDIIFNVGLKNNHSLKFYNLEFCSDNFKCQKSIKILYTTEKASFKKIVNSFIKKIDKNHAELDEDYMAELYLQVRAFNERSIVSEVAKPFNEKIDSLLQAIQNLKTQYSGRLKLNKEVRIYYKRDSVVKDTTFLVKYATVRFFNNKAKEVVLVGQLSSGPREFTVANVQFSLPLRSFRNSLNYVPISPDDNDSNKFLNYNDIFDYYPKEENSNYSARNKEYRIEVDSTVNIEERKLMDYFTAVVFSDFLGLNNQNANSLLQAEGRIKIPLWIHNFKKMSYLSSLFADINATIYNGFDDNSRFITPIDVELDPSNSNLISATINNFDYVKYNNVNAGIGLDFLKLELKGLSTEWSLGYGLRYFRAGLKHTEVDDGVDQVARFQLNALSHELSTNFEIRPQLNFGADLNIALNWLNSRGSVENLDILFNKENDNDKKEVLRLQLNLYSKIDPDKSNGGVYARIGGFYHLGAKDFYPQILVGYATNLSSFVNKFAKK